MRFSLGYNAAMNDDFHVTVTFGKGIPSDLQGKVMLHMERTLRENGLPAEVFKPTCEDDSKLRRNMTPLERARL